MADTKTEPSVFTKIINRELPATIFYEDDEFIAIDNINHVAPVHFLVIPKKPYATLEEVSVDDVQFHAKILQIARQVAKKLSIEKSYKLFMNIGEQVQVVHHVHLHVTGGWDQSATREELEQVGMRLHNDGLKKA
jgi:histidine triad (HIT) family protein